MQYTKPEIKKIEVTVKVNADASNRLFIHETLLQLEQILKKLLNSI